MNVEPSIPPSQSALATRKGRSVTPKQTVSGVFIVVVVLFALLNLQDVTMHWIVGTTHTPLIIVVALSAVIGAAVGFVAGQRKRSPTATKN
ncbi:MAG TPA: LapA family protein [Solirubrobacteraceae bacterium]|jgi:uncharacterized integral membrane protein|nr:LapA family protein [Solirubrobacteraceae bacterium]